MLGGIAFVLTLLVVAAMAGVSILFWLQLKQLKEDQGKRLDALDKRTAVNDEADAARATGLSQYFATDKLAASNAQLGALTAGTASLGGLTLGGESKVAFANSELLMGAGSTPALRLGASNVTIPSAFEVDVKGKLNVSGSLEAGDGVKFGDDFLLTKSSGASAGLSDADADLLQLVGKGLAVNALSVGTRATFVGGSSRVNPANQTTQFPGPDGKNAIRGDTAIAGDVEAQGDFGVKGVARFASNVDVQGPLTSSGGFFAKTASGPLLEQVGPVADPAAPRTGLAAASDASLRVYAPGGVSIATALPNGQFADGFKVTQQAATVNAQQLCVQDACITKDSINKWNQLATAPPATATATTATPAP